MLMEGNMTCVWDFCQGNVLEGGEDETNIYIKIDIAEKHLVQLGLGRRMAAMIMSLT
jgi:hypothetical protein